MIHGGYHKADLQDTFRNKNELFGLVCSDWLWSRRISTLLCSKWNNIFIHIVYNRYVIPSLNCAFIYCLCFVRLVSSYIILWLYTSMICVIVWCVVTYCILVCMQYWCRLDLISSMITIMWLKIYDITITIDDNHELATPLYLPSQASTSVLKCLAWCAWITPAQCMPLN